MKLGFICIGLMGKPMVLRLLAAGHDVTVWNRSRDKLGAVVEKGAKAAASPDRARCGPWTISLRRIFGGYPASAPPACGRSPLSRWLDLAGIRASPGAGFGAVPVL